MPRPEIGTRLDVIHRLLIDMDGVLFRGRKALPGAPHFLAWLRGRQVRFTLLTNNSTATPEENAARLSRMGIEVDPNEIYTSAVATARYLVGEGASGEAAYVIGEDGLVSALEAAGVTIAASAAGARWVVAGLDRRVTYEKLKQASFAVAAGARFVATNADASLPVEKGEAPGAGAIQAAIVATTGVRPLVIGKPEPRMLELAMRALEGSSGDTAMLGDRLDTDVEAAHRAGIISILVLTGVTSGQELRSSMLQPTLSFEGLPELMRAWEAACGR